MKNLLFEKGEPDFKNRFYTCTDTTYALNKRKKDKNKKKTDTQINE